MFDLCLEITSLIQFSICKVSSTIVILSLVNKEIFYKDFFMNISTINISPLFRCFSKKQVFVNINIFIFN